MTSRPQDINLLSGMPPMIKMSQYQQGYIFIQFKQGSLGRPRRWCYWSNEKISIHRFIGWGLIMNNYLVFFIFLILAGGSNFFIHRYLMNNWEYYRHLQKKSISHRSWYRIHYNECLDILNCIGPDLFLWWWMAVLNSLH